jgi:membrane protein YqaA with SNARE-associated domain
VDIETIVRSFGGFGLMTLSFVAATLFPLSSEAAFYASIKLGMLPGEALLFASLGNCLGITFNYVLGRWGSGPLHQKTLQSRTGKRAMEWLDRHGLAALLLSWLPILGDPLTIVAGLVRTNFLHFALICYSLRILRYLALLWLP